MSSLNVLVQPENPNGIIRTVDLSAPEFAEINPTKITTFRVEEMKKSCKAFKSGVFPGMVSVSKKHQVGVVNHFMNYYEFSKIVHDEVDENGKLTSLFLERRKDGWASPMVIKKSGDVIGYYLDGLIFHPDDFKRVEELIFIRSYSGIISERNSFKELINDLGKGISLELTGERPSYLRNLQEVLLSKFKN